MVKEKPKDLKSGSDRDAEKVTILDPKEITRVLSGSNRGIPEKY